MCFDFNYKILLIILSFFRIFSNQCNLDIYIGGAWKNEEKLISVKLEQKDYENFDNFINAIVEYFEKNNKDELLKDFKREVKNEYSLWKKRFNSIKNLKNFLDGKKSFYEFLIDKSIVYFSKDANEDFSFNLSSINSSIIYLYNSFSENVILKDFYKIKDEYKTYVDLLIKYLQENKLAVLTVLWLEYHELDKYFNYNYESNSMEILENCKDEKINKPENYKDIIVNNGIMLKDKEDDNKKDNEDNEKKDEEKDNKNENIKNKLNNNNINNNSNNNNKNKEDNKICCCL